MGKPSAFYLIYDDKTGSFVNINKIQSVTVNNGGSFIHLKDGKVLESPFKPRQILYKIRVIKHNVKKTGSGHVVGASPQSEPPEEVD